MKRMILLLILGISALFVNAQKVNGTVYSEHEAIAKTKAMWAAFVKGDKEAYLSFYADSVFYGENGKLNKVQVNFMVNGLEWWKGVESLKITDDSPATPDAIKYQENELWVQDWLRITGVHNSTGINVNIPCHFLYHFNKENKIDVIHGYGDFSSFFDEINNSQKTIENGTVYINHPYIVTVRKLVNAYCKEDMAAVKSFYAPNARFSNIAKNGNNGVGLETIMKQNKEIFDTFDNIRITQVGYPDCIYYAKNDMFTVYSWWTLSVTKKDGKKLSNIPFMMTHTFNKEGKITEEFEYMDSKQLE